MRQGRGKNPERLLPPSDLELSTLEARLDNMTEQDFYDAIESDWRGVWVVRLLDLVRGKERAK